MSKRIYITHSDNVSVTWAVRSVNVALNDDKESLKPGEVALLSNGCYVEYAVSKCPTFRVWRDERNEI